MQRVAVPWPHRRANGTVHRRAASEQRRVAVHAHVALLPALLAHPDAAPALPQLELVVFVGAEDAFLEGAAAVGAKLLVALEAVRERVVSLRPRPSGAWR